MRAVLLVAQMGMPPGLAAQAPGEAPVYRVRAVDRPASIRGRILLVGQRPELAPHPVVSDTQACGPGPLADESLSVGPTGGLGQVVVHLDGVTAGRAVPREAVLVDQRGCRFVPHSSVLVCGQRLLVANSDPIFHSVHAYAARGWYSLFNDALPRGAPPIEHALSIPGPVVLRCDAGHRWMNATIYVAPNPYATMTGPDGLFSLDGVPPGRSTLVVWHPLAGEGRREIHAGPEELVRVDVTVRFLPRPGMTFEVPRGAAGPPPGTRGVARPR